MALNAKKLGMELRSEWRPGTNVRKTKVFAALSEACACDLDGHGIEESLETIEKTGHRFRQGEIRLGDHADGYRIRDLFEELVVDRHGDPVGASFVQEFFDPRNGGNLMEAGAMGYVDSSAFLGVTGQLLVTEVLAPYDKEEYMVRKMIPTYNSQLRNERIIGLTPPADPDDDGLLAQEGQLVTYTGFGEQYVETPMTQKRQKGIALTKEAVFFNLTGTITQQGADVGDLLAFSEERECIGLVIGSTKTPTKYVEKRKNDSAPVSLDLFQAAGAQSGAGQLAFAYPNRPYPFVNDVPDNPLEDYTSIRTCDQAFSLIVDPNRGRPIVVGQPWLLAPHTRRIDITQILEAENIWKISAQGVNTPGAVITNSRNPLNGIGMTADRFMVSRLLQLEIERQLGMTAAQAQQLWFYGDLSRAFRYMVNWPVQVTAAPTLSEADFSQDIVYRWKASKMGCGAIMEPRCWIRSNAISQGSAY